LKRTRRQLAGPFVEVNCATLRGEGAMSALFGHVKGAFTGAVGARPGLLRTADRGILFLDEIGELGLDEQAMLLRALEEKRFLPVGSDEEAASEFQLIGGTNRSLADEVRTGRFRDDLLARINLWTFQLPGLRQRPEDIEPNLAYELERCSLLTGFNATFNKEAHQAFLRFAKSPEALW
jgi:transcriptional regulatory protein RtcR